MRIISVRKGRDQRDVGAFSPLYPPVLWPWILVFSAWTIVLVEVLSKQTFFVNHNNLLTQSHLPWIVALITFLGYWQVMTVAMMLPSSIPFVYMVVHASQSQQHPRATQIAFVAGYLVIWTSFAIAAFIGDTSVHWLVSNWFWLYMHSWLIVGVIFVITGSFQLSPYHLFYQGCTSFSSCYNMP